MAAPYSASLKSNFLPLRSRCLRAAAPFDVKFSLPIPQKNPEKMLKKIRICVIIQGVFETAVNAAYRIWG